VGADNRGIVNPRSRLSDKKSERAGDCFVPRNDGFDLAK